MKRVLWVGLSVILMAFLALGCAPKDEATDTAEGDEAAAVPEEPAAAVAPEAPAEAAPAAETAAAVAPVDIPKPDTKGLQVEERDIKATVKVASAPDPETVRVNRQKTLRLAEMANKYGEYFNGTSDQNLIKDGGFEQWKENARFPEGWGPLADLPTPGFLHASMLFRTGEHALRTIGSKEGDATMKFAAAPDVKELQGKNVVFGAWLHTRTPSKVLVRVIDDWKTYHEASPTIVGDWQLVVVPATIGKDSSNVQFAISVVKSDPPAEVVVDDAALVVLKDGDAAPEAAPEADKAAANDAAKDADKDEPKAAAKKKK